MGTSTRQRSQGLQTQAHELIKQFIVYDSENRMETIYTAPYDAPPDTACTRVDYEYRNATSKQVLKMQESNDVWDASYDI